ncbi:MAG: hypothetical protein JWN70_2059, partial [Planctomycetaceae bacterium]|nr:hypothetical protein [Planctomycetaceae bacterium]
KSRRAAATDSDEFLKFLEHRRRSTSEVHLPIPAKIAPTKDVAAAELAYWMSVFGDVKISELIEPDRPPRPVKRSPPIATPETEVPSKLVPARKPRSSTKSRATEPVPEKTPSPAKATPELFSIDWINELQRWVDEQQK